MPRAILVGGLGNGDEGKGSLVDHLVRKHGIRYVVRFNGGAQALHHVVNRPGAELPAWGIGRIKNVIADLHA